MPTCNATPDLRVGSPACAKQTESCDMRGLSQYVILLGFVYVFICVTLLEHTFCSSAVISCSPFTSLNFRSLTCLFESPVKAYAICDLLWLHQMEKHKHSSGLVAQGYSLWSSTAFGSVPFSRISPSGFSVPFRWVFWSNWDFSFLTWRQRPNMSLTGSLE